jgi:hypothetical protein
LNGNHGIAERDPVCSDTRRNPSFQQTRSAKICRLFIPSNFRFFKHQAPPAVEFKKFDGFAAGPDFGAGSDFALQLTPLPLENDPVGEVSPGQIPILSRFRTNGLP